MAEKKKTSSKIPENNYVIADMLIQGLMLSPHSKKVSMWSFDVPWLSPIAHKHACEMNWNLQIDCMCVNSCVN